LGTPRQIELKGMVRAVIYAGTEKEAREALERLMKKRGNFKDKKPEIHHQLSK
jgi:hypothetical protein